MVGTRSEPLGVRSTSLGLVRSTHTPVGARGPRLTETVPGTRLGVATDSRAPGGTRT